MYQDELGRGRLTLLSQDKKHLIIAIATYSQENREKEYRGQRGLPSCCYSLKVLYRDKEAWQAVNGGDFDETLPKMRVETFQNVMYEAGYARGKPGWKPPLTPQREKERYEWALTHNSDLHEEYDSLDYDFKQVVFADETPARIGEERGLIRTWCLEGERWDDNVKHDRNRKDYCLQLYASSRFNHKGLCHVYYPETDQEKVDTEAHIKESHRDQKTRDDKLQIYARRALNQLDESDVNRCYNTRKKQYVPSNMDYHRGMRDRGVDGYMHREGALKKVVPWIHSLEEKGITCVLQQGGAPPYKARISIDYLIVEHVERLWWSGHSPEVNAIEHAWPWIRRHVTKQFTPSCTAKQCERQWVSQWGCMAHRGDQSMGDANSRAGAEDHTCRGQKQLPRVAETPKRS